MLYALTQHLIDQILNMGQLPHLLPERPSFRTGSLAFCLELGALPCPFVCWKGFSVWAELSLGQVEAAELRLVFLLELHPTIFEFDLLQLVVDWLGFGVGLGVPLQLFQLL